MKIKNLLEENSNLDSYGDNTRSVGKHAEPVKLPVQVYSPWANIIVRFKIPDDVFDELKKMYEYTMSKEWASFGKQLVGQIKEEPEITVDIVSKYPKWSSFCMESVKNFVHAQTQVNMSSDPKRFEEWCKDPLLTKMNTMWFVKQKPGEYNPAHIHTNCKVSAIAYLKTPQKQIKDKKEWHPTDGRVTFFNNTGTDMNFSNSMATFAPEPGDMYVFGSLQHHMVYPYRSEDPNDERVSISFNADALTKSQLEAQNKHSEKIYEEVKKVKEQENLKTVTK